MGSLGPTEIILILLVLVLLFGAKKLPELARGSGRALRIFKAETKGLLDDDDQPAPPRRRRPRRSSRPGPSKRPRSRSSSPSPTPTTDLRRSIQWHSARE
ncbi:MAG: Sec-independent protein translocase subunit TatA [Nocardioidaceae bacterium]|nr:MAG: Sec-independent protein translocase subunit TatA [Nocardioidaceae bacterium]